MDTKQMKAQEACVERLFGAFSRRDIDEILGFFTEQAVYQKIPMARFTGHGEIAETLREFFVDGLEVEFQLKNLAVSENKVLTERLTRVRHKGSVREIPIMGIFEFDADTRISAWRDYFDRGQAGIA